MVYRHEHVWLTINAIIIDRSSAGVVRLMGAVVPGHGNGERSRKPRVEDIEEWYYRRRIPSGSTQNQRSPYKACFHRGHCWHPDSIPRRYIHPVECSNIPIYNCPTKLVRESPLCRLHEHTACEADCKYSISQVTLTYLLPVFPSTSFYTNSWTFNR